jgi:hypothetical protein
MAVNTVGTQLLIGANAIAEITSISGVGVEKGTFESTTLADSWDTHVSTGVKAGKEFTISGFFNPNDTLGQKAMYDALINDTAISTTVVYPTLNTDVTHDSIITDFSADSEVKGDGIQFEATIKPTGIVNRGIVASGGLTALSLTGTGGTLAPAFGAAVRSYAFTGVTAASVTVTATAANHTLKLYVDGVFTQTLTSGSASSAIAMSIGSKKLTILAYEAGKTIQVTEIVVQKAS